MIFCCCGWFYCIVNPPIRGDFLWWKYTLFWDRSMGWGAGSDEYLLLFFGSMRQLFLVSLFSPSSFLEAFLLSFILAGQEQLSFYSHLAAVIFWWSWSSPFFIFFGIFLFWFIFQSSQLCILRFFFLNLGGWCVFFEGVKKYFVKVEMMWSNFQATRDARDARARARGPRRPCQVECTKKIPKKCQKSKKSHFSDQKITS